MCYLSMVDLFKRSEQLLADLESEIEFTCDALIEFA
jgi:hypothetical protein